MLRKWMMRCLWWHSCQMILVEMAAAEARRHYAGFGLSGNEDETEKEWELECSAVEYGTVKVSACVVGGAGKFSSWQKLLSLGEQYHLI